jgi:hypothetical protein
MAGGNGSFDLNHLVLAGCARGDLDFALWILLGCLQQLLPLLRLSHESLIHCAEQAYVKALAVQVHFALEFHTVWPARDPFRESMIPFATIQLCKQGTKSRSLTECSASSGACLALHRLLIVTSVYERASAPQLVASRHSRQAQLLSTKVAMPTCMEAAIDMELQMGSTNVRRLLC